ncbi:hypothetical protein BgiMline_030346, partial [Biomphalaria glabrata]
MGPSLLYRPQTLSSASLAVQTLPSTSCDVSPLASPLHDALPISPTSHDVLTLDSASHSPAITHDVSPFPMIFYIFLQPPMITHLFHLALVPQLYHELFLSLLKICEVPANDNFQLKATLTAEDILKSKDKSSAKPKKLTPTLPILVSSDEFWQAFKRKITEKDEQEKIKICRK